MLIASKDNSNHNAVHTYKRRHTLYHKSYKAVQ
nr:MAG TPA: hypothetical protein [Caudoviricetes sp.]